MEVGTPTAATPAQWFAYFFMLFVYLFPIVYGLLYRKNPKQYPLFSFVWLLYGAFICLPLGRYLYLGEFYFKGVLTGNAFDEMALIYSLGFAFVLLGYFLGRSIYQHHFPKRKVRTSEKTGPYLNVALYAIPLLYFAGCLFDMYLKDREFYKYFNLLYYGTERKLFFLYEPIFPFLESLADSLIIALIALIIYKRKWLFTIAVGVAFILYNIVIGWRYRLILPLLGIFILQFQKMNWRRKFLSIPRFYFLPFVLILGLWALLFYTTNRFAIGWRNFEDIVWNPIELPQNILFDELSNTQVDALLYNYYHSGEGYHDRGESIFTATAYRAFGSLKPDSNYKAPILIAHTKALKRALDDKNALRAAGSPTHFGEYWYGMGFIGLGLLSFFWGILLSLEYYYQSQINFHKLLLAAGIMLSFQIITRGYTPQHIELAFFFALPLGIYWLSNQADKKPFR